MKCLTAKMANIYEYSNMVFAYFRNAERALDFISINHLFAFHFLY